MSVAAYADYRDSGMPWLGAVPRHWRVAAIKWMVDDDRPITYGIVQAGPDTPDGIPYVRPADMTAENGVSDMTTILRTTPEIAAPYQRSVIRAGDLICSIGPSFGKVMVVPAELEGGNLTQGTARIAPKSGIDRRFLFWILRSRESVAQWESSIGGATFRALNLEPLANTIGCLPPLDEQEAIAGFLDRETAKIDALVAEQERLIALLKEKRQAVISHAVTKGLNPNAPMKDSGIEWLGEIPAHWDTLKFVRVVAIAEGQVDPTAAPYRDMILVAPNHVESGTGRLLALETAADQGAESGKYQASAGDVIYSKIRPALAKSVVAPVDCLCSADMYPLKPTTRLRAEFLNLFILSPAFTAWATLESDRVAMPKINREKLNEVVIAVPPVDEQSEIVTDVLGRLNRFDALEAEAQSAITLLQERRAALISAAVTGKIDVREAVAKTIPASRDQKPSVQSLPSLRAVVGGHVVLQLGQMGRMAVMKGGYLAEAHCGLNELGGHYQRYAAGPYDRSLITAMERGAADLCGVQIVEAVEERERASYIVPKMVRAPTEKLRALAGEDRAQHLLQLLNALKGLSRHGVEAIATIYAVWNDLLADGRPADDNAIFTGVLTDWHPEKVEKFKRSDLEHWIAWMRRNNVIPNGTAPRTDHQGSLFA